MKFLSPAKINLMLKVLGQRDDGYHLLQTYFQLLDWGDYIEYSLTEFDEIQINGEFGTLKQEDNLIYKAIKLLEPYRKVFQGVKINVQKNIPQGSGLGGGSSNAGTTLRILNKKWKCQLTQEELQNMAVTLGADVPIFILNKSAMATGIGEELTPYPINNYYYVLIFPNTGIVTANVFASKTLNRNQTPIELSDINDKSQWKNACLPVVLDIYPEVKDIYNIASNFAPIYMSGTGSTLFSSFKSETQALQFIEQCPHHWKTVLCKSKINQ